VAESRGRGSANRVGPGAASGWVLHAEQRQLLWPGPQRLGRSGPHGVTPRRCALIESGRGTSCGCAPWISTLPVRLNSYRMVAAVMTKLQLARCGPPRARPRVVAPRQIRIPARRPHHVANSPHSDSRLGVAGSLERKTPSGLRPSTSSPLVSAGTTVTRQPSRGVRFLRMFCLMPKSYAPNRGVRVLPRFGQEHWKQWVADWFGCRWNQSGKLSWSIPRGPVGSVHLADAARLEPERRDPTRRSRLRRASRRGCADDAPSARVSISARNGHRVALHVLVGDLLGAPVGADGRESRTIRPSI